MRHLTGTFAKFAMRFWKVHKVWSVVIAIAVLCVGYYGYGKIFGATTETKYTLGTVSKGTIISTVSASGQISALNQLEIKPKASGEIVYIGVKPGQYVKAGTLIVQLDTTDALKSVRDAEANLESAQIAYEKLVKPATQLTLTQAQNALSNAQDSLSKSYSDSYAHVVNAFLDMPSIMTGLETVLIDDTAAGNAQWNIDYYKTAISQFDDRASSFRETAYNDYISAKSAYASALVTYQSLGATPSNASIEKALSDAYLATQAAAKASKSASALIQLYVDTYNVRNYTPVSVANTSLTNLNTYTSKLNTHSSTLLSDTNSLKQYKQTINEKQQSLVDIETGADELDIRSSMLTVTKAQNSYRDAQNNLANYYVRAPFSGTIAAVNAIKYDTAGSGTAVATLITNQRIAELSLNEVDAAKIKVGNKATLTFDAIEGLSIAGEVSQIDTIGTVSQGVVSYSVKIGFNSEDERIKPGMTVNASIITDVRQDVLTVPSSAVKTQNGTSYVQVFDPELSVTDMTQAISTTATPTQATVEIGISDDTNVEIVTGLTEGQQIVVKTSNTTNSTKSSSKSNTPSLLGGPGMR